MESAMASARGTMRSSTEVSYHECVDHERVSGDDDEGAGPKGVKRASGRRACDGAGTHAEANRLTERRGAFERGVVAPRSRFTAPVSCVRNWCGLWCPPWEEERCCEAHESDSCEHDHGESVGVFAQVRDQNGSGDGGAEARAEVGDAAGES